MDFILFLLFQKAKKTLKRPFVCRRIYHKFERLEYRLLWLLRFPKPSHLAAHPLVFSLLSSPPTSQLRSHSSPLLSPSSCSLSFGVFPILDSLPQSVFVCILECVLRHCSFHPVSQGMGVGRKEKCVLAGGGGGLSRQERRRGSTGVEVSSYGDHRGEGDQHSPGEGPVEGETFRIQTGGTRRGTPPPRHRHGHLSDKPYDAMEWPSAAE